jgi:hypothetical protein
MTTFNPGIGKPGVLSLCLISWERETREPKPLSEEGTRVRKMAVEANEHVQTSLAGSGVPKRTKTPQLSLSRYYELHKQSEN